MSNPAIFNYVIGIQGREYIVTIFQGGMSQWDDLGQGSLTDRIHGVQAAGSIVEIRISNGIYQKALNLAEKEKAAEIQREKLLSPAGEMAADIAQMDRLFTDFFWLYVNPLLPEPFSESA